MPIFAGKKREVMFIVIGIMVAGMVLGYVLRCVRMEWTHLLVTLLIWLLLFLLGIEVGENEQIMRGLHTLGLEALLLAVGGVLGSVLAAKWLWHTLHIRTGSLQQGATCGKAGLWQAMRGSVVIVAFFVVGTLCGAFGIMPFDTTESYFSYYALCVLMFSVGLGIGHNPQTLRSFRELPSRLFFLPLMTVLGTLVGSALICLLLEERSLTDCLAVGSGFAYYSLSSILITQLKTPSLGVQLATELGTIALMANIMREIMALLGAPLFARYFGRLAPICAGGATTMDTTLPVITRYAGKELVFVSILHGILVDLSVPFFVSFFCS